VLFRKLWVGHLSLIDYYSLECYHFNLAPIEFRDALAFWYLRMALSFSGQCDGCEVSFSLQHGLDCSRGGLVIR